MSGTKTDKHILEIERRLEMRDILNRTLVSGILALFCSIFCGGALLQRYVSSESKFLFDGIAGVILVVGGMLLYIPLIRDLIHGHIKIIEAKVSIIQIRKSGRGTPGLWRLVVENRYLLFNVGAKVAEKIKSGKRYRIEFLPFSKTILDIREVENRADLT